MNYGEFLEQALNGILISYEEYGSYQGDYIAIIEKGSNWIIYKGCYGSCSGCDWLEGTDIYSSDENNENIDNDDTDNKTKKITQKAMKEYFSDNIPFLIIPKSQLPDTLEEFKTLLPANSRTLTNDKYEELDLDAQVFRQMKNFKLDNLKYLEKKCEDKE